MLGTPKRNCCFHIWVNFELIYRVELRTISLAVTSVPVDLDIMQIILNLESTRANIALLHTNDEYA